MTKTAFVGNIRHMEPDLKRWPGRWPKVIISGHQSASLTEYHAPDNIPKLVAAVVDVETTGTNPDRDKIIELGICLFEYDRQNGRIYKVLGSWEWFEDPGFSIPPEITTLTGITDEMVAGHHIDERAVDDLLRRVVLVIAHNAAFDRRFLEKRLPVFAAKHWACSRSDIDWRAEGIRSSALEFIAYYAWSPGEFGRPRSWYRDVSDADKGTEVGWLQANVMGLERSVWALRISARDRHSDRCWGWGERLPNR